MKLSCDIIKDLLPLYHDDVCSVESHIIIEEHLRECEECKTFLQNIDNDYFVKEDNRKEDQIRYKSLKRLKKKLLGKNILISVISILCTFTVILGGYYLTFRYQLPIDYVDRLVNITIADDEVIDIVFNGDNYSCSYAFTKTISQDGIDQNIAYIYYTNSLWTKYFFKPQNHKEYQISIGNNIIVDYSEKSKIVKYEHDITSIYYLIGNYSNLSQLDSEEFNEATQNATLLWEK
ncbi:MAG: zf-HC2 domain-containing protein [Eubacteriaceae bacterium]